MEIHNFLWHATEKESAFELQLAREFCEFMAEHKLNGMTSKDTQVLTRLLSKDAGGVGAKIDPLFEAVRKSLEPQIAKEGYFFNERAVNPWGYTEGYAVWDWCYQKRMYKINRWYIAWGLMMGGDFFGVGEHVPSELLAFVVAHRDPNGMLIPLSKLNKSYRSKLAAAGWKFFPGNEREDLSINVVSVQKLANKAAGFTSSLIDWIDARAREARVILKQAGT